MHKKSTELWATIGPQVVREQDLNLNLNSNLAAVPHVTVEDVRKNTSSLKLNKSPGHDGVTAEHILYGGHHLQVHLTLRTVVLQQQCNSAT